MTSIAKNTPAGQDPFRVGDVGDMGFLLDAAEKTPIVREIDPKSVTQAYITLGQYEVAGTDTEITIHAEAYNIVSRNFGRTIFGKDPRKCAAAIAVACHRMGYRVIDWETDERIAELRERNRLVLMFSVVKF